MINLIDPRAGEMSSWSACPNILSDAWSILAHFLSNSAEIIGDANTISARRYLGKWYIWAARHMVEWGKIYRL